MNTTVVLIGFKKILMAKLTFHNRSPFRDSRVATRIIDIYISKLRELS